MSSAASSRPAWEASPYFKPGAPVRFVDGRPAQLGRPWRAYCDPGRPRFGFCDRVQIRFLDDGSFESSTVAKVNARSRAKGGGS